MPIYIYMGGSPNPQPQNPFLRLLVSVGILAAIIGLGVLLLPVIGVIALVILGIIAFLVIGGVIYRWIYGNPLDALYQRQGGMRVNPDSRPDTEPVREASEKRTRVRSRFRSRSQDIEDAVIVEERKKDSD